MREKGRHYGGALKLPAKKFMRPRCPGKGKRKGKRVKIHWNLKRNRHTRGSKGFQERKETKSKKEKDGARKGTVHRGESSVATHQRRKRSYLSSASGKSGHPKKML